MNIDEKEITILGFILSWLAALFMGGKAYGKLNAKVENNEDKCEELACTIQTHFYTQDGEQWLVTWVSHDIVYQRTKDDMKEIKEDIKEYNKLLSAIHEAVIRMDEREKEKEKSQGG